MAPIIFNLIKKTFWSTILKSFCSQANTPPGKKNCLKFVNTQPWFTKDESFEKKFF
jgi:hypothetical protein